MRYSPNLAGFLGALGLSLYVALFAVVSQSFTLWLKGQAIGISPILATALFLMAFVFSVLVSAALVFTYPALLFIQGKMREALQTVFWTIAWLALFFLLALIGGTAFVLARL